MENPNLNEIVIAKVKRARDRLSDLRRALRDRWIATDSYLYQKVEEALDNIEGMFSSDIEELADALVEYTRAQDTYNATHEIKEVKHPKTGEIVKVRVQKPQVRMAVNTSNKALLEEQIKAEKNAIFIGGKFIPNPFIYDGLGTSPNVPVEAPTDLAVKGETWLDPPSAVFEGEIGQD